MNHPNHIGRESRLIYRRASDFGYTSSGQAKVDSRDLSRQVQTQRQSNLDAQTTQQAEVNRLNAIEAEKAATAKKNETEFTPTTYSRTGGAANVGTSITGTQLDEDGKAVTSRQGSSVVMDRSLPVSSVDKSGAAANDPRNPTGFIPEGATVDANVTARANRLGVLTPAQSLQQQRDADLATIPTTIKIVTGTNKDGSPIYQTIANPNLASDQAKIKNRFAQEDLTKSTNQTTETRNVQSRTAGDAATQKSQTPPKLPEAQKSAPQAVPDEVKIEEYGTMIDGAIAASGDPLGPMIKGMMMMEYRNSLTKEANALTSLDSAIEGAGAADDAFQKMNDRYLEIHRKENGKLTNLLTETRDSTEKYLDEQKERDLARLTWEQDSETRKLDKQKTDQMLSKEIQLSLTGGAFSGAANDRLDATEREWDVAIADLGKEYSFKKADQSAFYTQKYVETQNQFRMDIFNAAKSLTSTIEGYEIKGFNSLAAKGNAIAGAKKDYNDTLTKLSDDRVTSMKGMVKDMRETLKDAAKDKKDGIIKTKDTLGFISDISKEIGGNKMVQNARTVMIQFSALESEYGRAQSSVKEGKQFSDQALISLFNKILDPTSVVREAEYNRSSENMAFGDRMWSKFLSLRDGGVLTPEVRTELFNAAKTLSDTYNTQLEDEYQPYISRANVFNGQDGLTTKVRLQDIFPPSLIPYISEDQQRTIDMQMGGTQSSSQDGTQSTDGPTSSWVASIGPVVTGSPYHTGKDAFAIDIDGKTGDPIPSSVSGKVISVDKIGSGGYGKNVVIQDAMGYNHLFAHMDSVDVKRGSSVNSAQSLGKMGNTGNVRGINGRKPKAGDHETGSHLHYRITDKSGQPVSYNEYLAFNNEAKGTGKTQYSLVPSAHASEPHNSIYIEPEPEAKPEPKKAPLAPSTQMGRTLSMPDGPKLGSSLKLKVLGAFKNISTGEVVYPTDPGKVSFYQSKPAGWKDLNKDEPTFVAKPISFKVTPTPKK